MCDHGPGHAHSQIAHSVRDTNSLSSRDQHCLIMEALRVRHLAEGLIAPLIICVAFLYSSFLSVAHWQLHVPPTMTYCFTFNIIYIPTA